ncbi:MAG: hypothetical protein ACK58L_06005 [Planctomycetota bacterium]
MKLFVRAVLSAACLIGTMAPASACCLWPFGGWWGAGYAPGYGYGAGYPAVGYYAPTVGYYSVGYAGSSACCAPACCATSCCDPCGSSCGGSCAGTTSSGTLKPSADDKFDRSKYDEELERDRQKLQDSTRDSVPPTRRDENPEDGFGAGRGVGDTGRDQPFGADPIEGVNNKPPMGDATEGVNNKPPMGDVDPAAGGEPAPFLENNETEKKPEARRLNADRVVAHSAGMLNSAGGARRLASQSLPAGVGKPTSFAGKTPAGTSSSPAPIRWISVPSPEGQVRL